MQSAKCQDVTWILTTQFRPFTLLAPKRLNYMAFQSLKMRVTVDGYYRNVSCTLNKISTFFHTI